MNIFTLLKAHSKGRVLSLNKSLLTSHKIKYATARLGTLTEADKPYITKPG